MKQAKKPVQDLFGAARALVGMVHLQALPGTPNAERSVGEIAQIAVREAIALEAAGFQGILIENMHDRPYQNGTASPEVIAAMAVIASQVKASTKIPVGIQILAGANEAALAVALVSGADFIRAEGFVFGHLADEGWMESCAGPLLRKRKSIGAEHIKIFVDIKKKHSAHAVTADVSIEETAHAAEFFLADGVIVTGTSTGKVADLAEIQAVHESVKLPVLVGSGVTAENVHSYVEHADILIVGSSIKVDGLWSNPLDPKRISALVAAFRKATA